MCGLCGLFGAVHWSDTAAHPEVFAGGARRTIRAERLHRVAAVNAALAPLRMRVADFQGSAYVLATATGKRAVVGDLSAIWAAVERLRGTPLDPLDPEWGAALASAAR